MHATAPPTVSALPGVEPWRNSYFQSPQLIPISPLSHEPWLRQGGWFVPQAPLNTAQRNVEYCHTPLSTSSHPHSSPWDGPHLCHSHTRNKPYPTSQGFLLPSHYSARNLQGSKWEILYKVADMKSKGEMLVLETLTGAIVKPP